MSDALVFTIDLYAYQAMREKEMLHEWLEQNGIRYDTVFRFQYHLHLGKIWVESFLRDENDKFYQLPGEEEIAWGLWESPVRVNASSVLLTDMAQASALRNETNCGDECPICSEGRSNSRAEGAAEENRLQADSGT